MTRKSGVAAVARQREGALTISFARLPGHGGDAPAVEDELQAATIEDENAHGEGTEQGGLMNPKKGRASMPMALIRRRYARPGTVDAREPRAFAWFVS